MPQVENNWNSKWSKDTEGENHKKIIFVYFCEINYSEYQLKRSIYKIITSVCRNHLKPVASQEDSQTKCF